MDDSFAYSTKFRLRVLVQPVYPLRKSEYDKHLKLLRRHSRIALADVPAAPAPVSTSQTVPVNDKRSILPALTPSPASRGTLQLDFIETWDCGLQWLEEFEVHRRVCAVIGIVDCVEWGQKLDDAVASFGELTLEKAPSDAFAYRCYAFNPNDTVADNADGLVVIPNVGDLGFYMHTLLAEVCSAILAGLSDIFRGLENCSLQTPHPYMAKAMPKSPPSNSYSASLDVAGSPVRSSIAPPDMTTPKTRAKGNASPVADSPETRMRRKHAPARVFKLQGDIYALSGRVNEATNCYLECMSLSKSTGDIVWQAAATEGRIMTMVYEAQPASAHRLSVSSGGLPSTSLINGAAAVQTSQLDVALLLGLYQQVLILYARGGQRNSATMSINGDGISSIPLPLAILDGPNCIHPLIYIETCFRLLRLQLLVFIYGENPRSEMLSGLLNPAFRLSPPGLHTYLTGTSGTLSRVDMLNTMFLYQQQLPHAYLRQRERIAYLASHTQVLNVLHTRRRRALFQQCLAVAAADSISARKPQGAKPTDIVHSTPEAAGSSRVLQILEDICQVYGLRSVPASNEKEDARPIGRRMIKSKHKQGWPDLQLQALRIAVFVSETLPDYAGAMQYTAASLQLLNEHIGDNDQYRLSQNMIQLHAAVSKRNSTGGPSMYWGPESMLVSIEVAALSPDRTPVNSALRAQSISRDFEGSFLPYASRYPAKQSNQPTLVAGEVAEFLVTMTNPFLFTLNIENISLAAEGVNHTAYSCSVSLQPAAFITVTLRLLPKENGQLLVKGCHVTLIGCEPREIGLRQFNTRATISQMVKADETNTKRRPSAQDDEAAMSGDLRSAWSIQCNVTKPLPLLRIHMAEYSSEMLVLSEGESLSLTVKFENVSDLPIHWLTLGLEDNHTAQIRNILLDETLDQAEVYRLELGLRDAPAVSIESQIQLQEPMLPGCVLHQTILIRGYADLSSARLFLNYGCKSAPAMDNDLTASARQAVLELNITVHPTVQCKHFDILPVCSQDPGSQAMHQRTFSSTSIGRAIALENDLKDILQDLRSADHCLAVLTCRNASSRTTFEITATHQNDPAMRSSQRIDPGGTVNLLLPITRFRISKDQCNASIPSLYDKQFVVGKDKSTASDRRLFWYENKLLETLNLKWREVGTRRSGSIELKAINLDEQMLQLLRSNPVNVTIAVTSASAGDTSQRSARSWRVEAGSFFRIDVIVTSLLEYVCPLQISLTPHRGAINSANHAHHDPIDVSSSVEAIARHFLLDGTAVKQIDCLMPGERAKVDFSICALARGHYDILFSISSHDPYATTRYNEISLHEHIQLHVA